MGQQESSYRKLDGVARRRTRVKPAQGSNNNNNNNNNSDADNGDTTSVDKSSVDNRPHVDSKSFSLLPSLSWRRTALGAAGDTAAWPGWYHGWCNRAQVHTQSLLYLYRESF